MIILLIKVVPIKFEDFPNKFKGRMLWREHIKHVVDNKLYTEEMEKAYNHLKVLNYITWLSFPVQFHVINIVRLLSWCSSDKPDVYRKII